MYIVFIIYISPVCTIPIMKYYVIVSSTLVSNITFLDSKVHGANMGPTWVLSAPGGSHVGPMNLAIWVI